MSNTNTLSVKADARQIAYKNYFANPEFMSALAARLPKHITPQRMIRVTLAALQNNPDLLKCTAVSIIRSMMIASALGLEPDGGPLGQGYLVPFKGECQFIPGYRGLIKLARNSGEVADVWAEVVYSKDEFKYTMGLHPDIQHTRDESQADPGELTHAYAVARFRDGERKFVVLPKREVEQIRKVSKMGTGGAWVQWPAEMWKKTAIRRLSKYLPLSVELQNAIDTDGDSIDVEFGGIELPTDLPSEALPAPEEDEGDKKQGQLV